MMDGPLGRQPHLSRPAAGCPARKVSDTVTPSPNDGKSVIAGEARSGRQHCLQFVRLYLASGDGPSGPTKASSLLRWSQAWQ